ncbi:MAG TPA: histidine kinase dimerization/phospho-acceptor domain-containing protein, partial [Roseiflexaceae bacterium]|nr:histidine kinase dimerization/phospho-acceptor domain-containing protein [Roseiflexaceae bacterium]
IWTLLTTFTNVVAAAFVNLQLLDQLQQRAERLEEEVEERTAQLKRSRDLLRIVFDHLPDGLVLLDKDARMLAANEAFCRRVLGLLPTEVIGRSYAAITRELKHKALLQIEQQPLGTGLRRVSCTDTVGHQRWYEVEHFTITVDHAQQTIERWRDITQQEELKRKLRVHEQLTSIGQLAASVVHEIGNPLQGVRSCLDLCREDGALTPSANEYLTLADHELERINNLLDRLREIYRRSHGGAI